VNEKLKTEYGGRLVDLSNYVLKLGGKLILSHCNMIQFDVFVAIIVDLMI